MKGDKYPGEVEIEIIRVDDWDPEPLFKYMEHCRKIKAEMDKKKDKSA